MPEVNRPDDVRLACGPRKARKRGSLEYQLILQKAASFETDDVVRMFDPRTGQTMEFCPLVGLQNTYGHSSHAELDIARRSHHHHTRAKSSSPHKHRRSRVTVLPPQSDDGAISMFAPLRIVNVPGTKLASMKDLTQCMGVDVRRASSSKVILKSSNSGLPSGSLDFFNVITGHNREISAHRRQEDDGRGRVYCCSKEKEVVLESITPSHINLALADELKVEASSESVAELKPINCQTPQRSMHTEIPITRQIFGMDSGTQTKRMSLGNTRTSDAYTDTPNLPPVPKLASSSQTEAAVSDLNLQMKSSELAQSTDQRELGVGINSVQQDHMTYTGLSSTTKTITSATVVEDNGPQKKISNVSQTIETTINAFEVTDNEAQKTQENNYIQGSQNLTRESKDHVRSRSHSRPATPEPHRRSSSSHRGRSSSPSHGRMKSPERTYAPKLEEEIISTYDYSKEVGHTPSSRNARPSSPSLKNAVIPEKSDSIHQVYKSLSSTEIQELVASGAAQIGKMLVKQPDGTFDVVEVLHVIEASAEDEVIELNYIREVPLQAQHGRSYSEPRSSFSPKDSKHRRPSESREHSPAMKESRRMSVKDDYENRSRRSSMGLKQKSKVTQCPLEKADIGVQIPDDKKQGPIKSGPARTESPETYKHGKYVPTVPGTVNTHSPKGRRHDFSEDEGNTPQKASSLHGIKHRHSSRHGAGGYESRHDGDLTSSVESEGSHSPHKYQTRSHRRGKHRRHLGSKTRPAAMSETSLDEMMGNPYLNCQRQNQALQMNGFPQLARYVPPSQQPFYQMPPMLPYNNQLPPPAYMYPQCPSYPYVAPVYNPYLYGVPPYLAAYMNRNIQPPNIQKPQEQSNQVKAA